MSEIFDAALAYAERGLSIVPVRAVPPKPGEKKWQKKPLVSWTARQDKAPSEEQIRGEWGKWPTAMIGCVTGRVSGICTLDIDDDEGRRIADELVPDSLIVPTFKTMSGGLQMVFRNPESSLPGAVRFLPGLDYRGEKSLTILPPSHNGKGGNYRWLEGLSLDEAEPSALPDAIINILNSLYKDLTNPTLQSLTNLTKPYKMFIEGRRDEDLFHAANCLVKGGMPQTEIEQVLNILAKNCEPPFPESEIQAKIKSAMQRAERRERNLSEEIRTWVTLQEGYFDLTNLKQTLQLLTSTERQNADVIIHRLKKEDFIEKYGNKAGVYRRIDREFERVDFMSASGNEFMISLPLGLAELVKLYSGNLAVIAGSKEAGKTALLLNVAAQNLGGRRAVYLNSEMGADEIKNRLQLFDGIPLTKWAKEMEVYHLKSTQMPADFIDGSETIWLVDYLEIAEDFSKIALPIAGIHERLDKGIAFIGIQKADGKEIGRGADFSREKARLYLSLDWDSERRFNRIKIIDCKAWRGRNPRGLVRYYKLVNGARIIPQGSWA